MSLDAKHYLLEIKLKRDKIVSFEHYPFSLPAVKHLETLTLHPAVTFIVGENGTGKSTLLEAIAVAWGFNPEGGSRNFRFSTRASHSSLHEALRLIKTHRRPKDGFFLRAESFFNIATEIEQLDEGPGGAAHHQFIRRSLIASTIAWRIIFCFGNAPIWWERVVHSR